jgi:hypothetical protein
VWEVEVELHAILTSALEWSRVVASRPDRLILRCILYTVDRRFGGPQSRSGCGGEEKSHCCLCRQLNRGRPVRSLVTALTQLSLQPSIRQSAHVFANKTRHVDARFKQVGINSSTCCNDVCKHCVLKLTDCVVPVATIWRVLGMWIENTASRCGG